MTPIDREIHRAAVRNKKERLAGIHNVTLRGGPQGPALAAEVSAARAAAFRGGS
jgi:hypothetical protein